MKAKKHIILLTLFSLSLCIFLFFLNSCVVGHDSVFHLTRIEHILIGIENGDYFPTIFPYLYDEFGYITNLFYSSFFLYIPVLFCLLGVPIIIAYKIFNGIIIFATVFSCYWCVKKITKNENSAFIAAIIYAGSSYFAVDLFIRNALGESLAFVFLPFALYGIYETVLGDDNNFLPLVIGFGGLLLSHILSLMITSVFFALFLLFNIDKIIRRPKRLISITKAVTIVVFSGAFFLFPLAEQMLKEKFFSSYHAKIFSPYNVVIRIRNLFWGGNLSENPYFAPSLGILILIALIFSCIVLVIKFSKINRFYILCLLFALISIIMSTSLFPWYKFDPELNIIQFPSRFHLFTTLFISFAVGLAYDKLFSNTQNKITFILLFVVCFAGIVQFSSTTYKGLTILNDKENPTYVYDSKIFWDENYLHINNNRKKWADRKEYKNTVTNQKQGTISNLERDYYNRYIYFENNQGENSLEVSAVYYLGYSAVLKENNQQLEIYPSDNGWVEIDVSNIPQGNIILTYKGTLIQKVSPYISGIFILVLLIYVVKFKKTVNRRL